MKEGSRFVDSDMHVVEPWDLFERHLDPAFKHRVTTNPTGGLRGLANFLVDSEPTNGELNTMQYNRVRDPLRFARSNTAVDFARQRGFDAEAQLIAMETEGIDIAVLFPTLGLSFVEKSGTDPHLSHAISRAYNDWLHEFCQHSPHQLKMAAMLPMQDVKPRLPGAPALCQGVRRRRRLRSPPLHQRPLLAFQVLEPLLRPPGGAGRAHLLPRRHRHGGKALRPVRREQSDDPSRQ